MPDIGEVIRMTLNPYLGFQESWTLCPARLELAVEYFVLDVCHKCTFEIGR